MRKTTTGRSGEPLTFETAKGQERWRLPTYTLDQVRSLPASVDMVDVARSLGMSKSRTYELLGREKITRGSFPIPVTQLGPRSWRARLVDLLDYLTRPAGEPEAPDARISA